MPLPNPKKSETEDEYVTRCMKFISDEGEKDLTDESTRKQVLAMCYSNYRKMNESKIIDFIEILKG